MRPKARIWLYGLLSGFVGGFAGALDSCLALMVLVPSQFNLGPELIQTLKTSGVLGLLAGGKCAVAYLKQSPLPPPDGDTKFITRLKKTMKTKLYLLFVAMAVIVGTVGGCLGPINYNDPAYIEQKAYRVSERVTVKMLTYHPDRRDKFVIALADLKALKGKTNTTMADVIAIVQRVPKVENGKVNFYVTTGVLFFEDELSTVGVKNPALVTPTINGLERGVGEGLEETKGILKAAPVSKP